MLLDFLTAGANFTAVIVAAVKLAPAVRKSNNNNQTWFEENKRERDKLVMQEGNNKMTHVMINRLIY